MLCSFHHGCRLEKNNNNKPDCDAHECFEVSRENKFFSRVFLFPVEGKHSVILRLFVVEDGDPRVVVGFVKHPPHLKATPGQFMSRWS